MNLLTKIGAQPYRFFFPLGIFLGLFGVAHWLLYGLGITPKYSGMEHASIQIQSFMLCFVVGFLLTAMPRMLLTRSATPWEILYFLIFILATPPLQVAHCWVAVEICFILNLAGLGFFIYRRFGTRQSPLPSEFVLLAFAFLHGIVGAVCLAASQTGLIGPWAALAGRQMVQLGFMLSVVMGVGGFLAPRLMGFYAADVATIELDPVKREKRRRRSALFHALCGVLLFASFWLEPLGLPTAGAVLRAVTVSAQLLWTTRVFHPLRERNIALFLLWASLWLIILGLWGAAFFPTHRVAALHLVFIGGFSLLTMAVATKVIFTHAGYEHLFHERMIPLWILGFCVFVSLVFRVLADLLPDLYFRMLVVASSSWILGTLVWLGYMAPKLIHLAGAPGGCPARRRASQQTHTPPKI